MSGSRDCGLVGVDRQDKMESEKTNISLSSQCHSTVSVNDSYTGAHDSWLAERK